ncbi:MAG: 16S rRNA (uracil(1498)-N(3))-methyltransferase [Bdellovibrionales bacterium]|nr:16S rRNA (uracil(1498)-N(3))-methyltransferase [Bdellovibrionales bacterium]
MRRYWADHLVVSADKHCQIDGDLFHHIFKVCRTEKGNVFEILGAKENTALVVKTLDVAKKFAILEVIEERALPVRKLPHIYLHISIPKIPTFEAVLAQAVELGVTGVGLFASEYSFIKDMKHKSLQKTERWKKIIIGATQQTGRSDVLQLQPIVSLKESLNTINQNPNAMGLFAYEGNASFSWREAVQGLKKKQVTEVHCFVGSEGGFSDAEVALFQDYGMQAMTMGEQVLRVETACVALVSSIKYELEI